MFFIMQVCIKNFHGKEINAIYLDMRTFQEGFLIHTPISIFIVTSSTNFCLTNGLIYYQSFALTIYSNINKAQFLHLNIISFITLQLFSGLINIL